MKPEVNSEDYVWVIVEENGGEETFLGMSDELGHHFIPVTAQREQGQALLDRLPPTPPAKRSLEAIHRTQLTDQADSQGFSVFVVDAQGRVVQRLTP